MRGWGRAWRAGMARGRAFLLADWRERVAQDIGTVLAGHLLRLALGLASSAVLARGLGPIKLSLFSVAGTVRTIGATAADFGLYSGAVRHIAGDLEQEPERARRHAAAYARLKLAGGAAFALGAFLLARPIADLLALPERGGPWFVRLASLGLLATAFAAVFSTILNALRRFRHLVLAQSVNILSTLVLVAWLWRAGRLTVASALAVGIASALLAGVMSFWLLPQTWRAALRLPVPLRSPESHRLLTFSRWLWLSALVSILFAQGDLILLNHWLGAEEVGFYALARNLAGKAEILHQTLHVVLLPGVSALSGAAAYRRYARRTLVRGLLLAGVLLLALPLARPFILLVYGATYAPSVGLFYGLMLSVLLDLAVAPVYLLALPLDAPQLLAWLNGLQLALLLGGGALLVPAWGAYGMILARLGAKLLGVIVAGLILAGKVRAGKG